MASGIFAEGIHTPLPFFLAADETLSTSRQGTSNATKRTASNRFERKRKFCRFPIFCSYLSTPITFQEEALKRKQRDYEKSGRELLALRQELDKLRRTLAQKDQAFETVTTERQTFEEQVTPLLEQLKAAQARIEELAKAGKNLVSWGWILVWLQRWIVIAASFQRRSPMTSCVD